MRRRSYTLTSLLVCLLVTSGIPAGITGAQAHSNDALSTNAQTMTLPLDFPSATREPFNNYISLSLAGGTGYTRVPGAPMMPMYGTMLPFPVDTRITGVTLLNATYEVHVITKKVMPAASPVSLLSTEIPTLSEGQAYFQNALFPAKEVDFSVTTGAGDLGGLEAHMMVHVYPLRSNPVTGQLVELRHATLSVQYLPSMAPLPRGNQTYDILVLTPPEFQGQMQRYVDYKESLGYSVKLVNLTQMYGNSVFNVSTGRDNQEKIKLFIKQAIENWTIRFVVLTGDVDKFPIRRADINDVDGQQTPTDLYYGDIFKAGTTAFSDWDKNKNNVFGESSASNANADAVDLDPDVSVSRYPASTGSELSVMINKTISYAENVTTGAWFQNVTLVGTDTFSASYGDTSGVAEGEYACDQAYNSLPLFCATKYYEKKGTFDPAKIKNGLNRGEGFALFSNHGNVDGVCFPSSGGGPGLGSATASALTNGPKLPLSILDACLTHAVDYSESLGEYLVLNPNGGSINSIGATRIGYGMFGVWHTYANSGYMLVHLTGQFNKGTVTPSQMLDRTKRSYLSDVGIWDYADFKTLVSYICLGDPATILGGQGIKLSADNSTRWADPGAGATYEVLVQNTGLHPDDLQLYVNGSLWNCTMDTGKLHLQANASATATVQVFVDPMAGALEQDNATVTIISGSTGLPVRLNLTTGANIIRKLDFSLETFKLSAYPGDNLSMNCTFRNDGNIAETARICVTGGQGEWRPELVFGNYSVPLRSTLVQFISFQVPPKTLCGSYKFRFEMATASGLDETAGLDVDIQKTYGFEVRTVQDRQYCGPGGARFDLAIDNLGNHEDFCQLDALDVPDTWTIACPSSLDFNAFEERTTSITLKPDDHALAGDYIVPVTVTTSSGELVHVIDLTATVNKTSSLRLTCPENSQAADRGSDVVFRLAVDSRSNFNEPVDFQVQRLPDGWSWFQASPPLVVSAFSSAVTDIALDIPNPCEAGWYSVDVIASTPQWKGLASLCIEVRDQRGFTALLDTEQAVLRPGEQAVFTLELKNTGNCRDNYLLDSDGQFPVDFPRNMIGIEPQSSDAVNIIVTAPASIRSGTYDIGLNVSSNADPALQKLLTIKVRIEKISNLMLDFDARSEVLGGSTGTFLLRATNLGSDAETLGLAGLDLPPWNFSFQPAVISPGATVQIPVTFTVPQGLAGGSYNLSFIASTDAQSWRVIHQVEVPPPDIQSSSNGGSSHGPSVMVYIAFVAIFCLSMMLVAFAWRSRRKLARTGTQPGQRSLPPLPPMPATPTTPVDGQGTATGDPSDRSATEQLPIPPPPPWYAPPGQ